MKLNIQRFSKPKTISLLTVFALIERNSWLERHGRHFGYTMVHFRKIFQKDYIFRQTLQIITIVQDQKMLKLNRTPAFYWRGHIMSFASCSIYWYHGRKKDLNSINVKLKESFVPKFKNLACTKYMLPQNRDINYA